MRITEIYKLNPADHDDRKVADEIRQRSSWRWKNTGVKLLDRYPVWRSADLSDYVVVDERRIVAYLYLSRTEVGDREGKVVTEVGVKPDYQREGIAIALYRALIEQGIILVSGGTQTPGGQAIWQKLIRANVGHIYVSDFDNTFVRPYAGEDVLGNDMRLIISEKPL